mmetsp:Transcript_112288/g.328361  ORF Transcript_112288/g.328361 Transcript_112288/m.328361 type:complete len:207 (+) Transcript_112288:246-866(+)
MRAQRSAEASQRGLGVLRQVHAHGPHRSGELAVSEGQVLHVSLREQEVLRPQALALRQVPGDLQLRPGDVQRQDLVERPALGQAPGEVGVAAAHVGDGPAGAPVLEEAHCTAAVGLARRLLGQRRGARAALPSPLLLRPLEDVARVRPPAVVAADGQHAGYPAGRLSVGTFAPTSRRFRLEGVGDDYERAGRGCARAGLLGLGSSR